jgi:hypothetical protein
MHRLLGFLEAAPVADQDLLERLLDGGDCSGRARGAGR